MILTILSGLLLVDTFFSLALFIYGYKLLSKLLHLKFPVAVFLAYVIVFGWVVLPVLIVLELGGPWWIGLILGFLLLSAKMNAHHHRAHS